MSIHRTVLCVASMIAFGLTSVPAAERWHTPELVEADHVYTLDYVTPHVQWARPLPGGKVKVLFFVRAKGSGAREIAELCQRTDIEPQIVYYNRAGSAVENGKVGAERALRLVQEGADVFVLGNCVFEGMSVEAQYYLLRQVVTGKGLVCFGKMPKVAFTEERVLDDLPQSLLTGLPLASLPRGREMAAARDLTEPTDPDLARALMKRYRLGKGRALGITYPGLAEAVTPRLDFTFEALHEYEYWAALAVKAVLWAAGRDPLVELAPWPEAGHDLHRGDLPTSLEVSATSHLAGAANLTFKCALCRDDGQRIDLGEQVQSVASAQTATVSVELPRLRAGQYRLEVIISGPRGVEAFGAQGIRVTSTRGVEEVVLGREFAEVGETIEGVVALRGQNFAADEKLRVRLRDGEGRVFARQDLAGGAAAAQTQGGQVPFSFAVPECAGILTRAEAVLMDAAGEVEQASASFTVPHRCRNQFNFVMWDYPRGVLGYWGLRSMRDEGVTVMLSGSNPPPEIAALDLAYVPYTTRILEKYDDDSLMEPVCWNNEPEVDEYVQEIADKYLPSRQHGVYVYSLGDENHTRGACAHPACIEAYRAWLKEQYDTIEALNASWGSEYQSFDEIELYQAGDVNAKAALNDGILPRWYDRQAFKRHNYAHFCGRFARKYAEMDPPAITGFEGAGRFGDDYGECIAEVGFWGPYPGIGDDIIRSLAPRSLITSNWMGYHREAQPMVQKMWRMISNGYHGVWWWRWDNIGKFHGFLAPDFHPWDDTSQPVIDEMRDIQDGLGNWMLAAEMPHDGIGLLYSMPSAFAGGSAPGRTSPVVLAHQAFLEATQDLGLQAHYLSDRTVAAGDLNDGDERALLLPMGCAIPDQVAEEIREFVRAGGLLIADLRPGLRDGHCKLRDAGALYDVFGIAQAPQELPEMADAGVFIDAEIGRLSTGLSLPTQVDPSVVPAGAEALAEHDGVPLLLVHQFGQGRAVLLNFSAAPYLSLREDGEELELRALLGVIYASAGIEPPFKQSGPDGPLRGTETVRWQAGDITLIGLFKTIGDDGPATTILPEAGHVYDLRNDKYLGKTNTITGQLRVGFANLYALTPEPIGDLTMSLSEREASPGEVTEAGLRVRGKDQGPLPIKLSVLRPDGTEEGWPRRELLTQGGQVRFKLTPDFDAQPGVWRVIAREVISGQVDEAEVLIKAAE